MGQRPKGYTLDRIDVFGNYEPGNLRWANKKTQANNRRLTYSNRINVSENVVVEDNLGNMLSLRELATVTGIHVEVLKYRYAAFGDFSKIVNGIGDTAKHQRKLSVRTNLYKEILYTTFELSIIASIPYTTMRERLRKYGWSVKEAVETPLYKNRKENK